jgi:hypothetical protein
MTQGFGWKYTSQTEPLMESKEEVLSVLGRAFQTDDTQPRIDRSEQLLRRAGIRRSEPNIRWVEKCLSTISRITKMWMFY